MANRYWVGGSGTWDATTTTNWSTAAGLSFTASCSGTTLTTTGSPALVVGMTVRSATTNTSLGTVVSGSVNSWVVSVGGTYASQTMTAATVGASAPTSADDVTFNSGSGAAPTVTMGTNAVCGAFTATAPTSGTLTLAFSTTGNLNFSGNWSNPSTLFAVTGAGGTGISYVGSASSTLTTNNVSFPTTWVVNGTGTLTLATNFTTTVAFTVTQGTFSTSASNYTFVATNILSSNSNTRTISLNGSTVTLSGSTPITFTTATNLTFNAGTSTITCSSTTATFDGGGKTFSTVSFTGTSNPNTSITGANTFTTLTFATPSVTGINSVTLSANQTVSGTLTLGATNSATGRVFILSDTLGTARTLTVATIATLSDVDFRDITAAGASGTWSGTRLGNCHGNSNITFPAAKTVYYNLATGTGWSSTAWAPSSGGTPDINNFPLAQDTAVFDNSSTTSTGTITYGLYWNIGTLDMSARTSALTFNPTGTDGTPVVYGSWKNGTGVTLSGTTLITFFGRTPTQIIQSNGVTFTQPITINNVTGTVQLQDALTQSSTVATTLTTGTIDLNGKTWTVGTRLTTATGTKNLTFNGGTLICPAANATSFNNAVPTGFTTTAGTGTGVISMTAATAKTFVGGGSTFNCTLQNSGAGALTVSGSNTFTTISNSVQPTTFTFTSGTTQTLTNWSVNGTAGNLVTIGASTTSAATLSKASGTVSSDYLSISYSTASGGATWYAGVNSTNGGNNTGWTFTAPPVTSSSGNFFLMFI